MRRAFEFGRRPGAARPARFAFALALLSLSGVASAQEVKAARGREAKRARAASARRVPTVPVCELILHPERYHGKVVRTSAVESSGYHGSWLYAVCAGKTQNLSVSLDCGDDASCAKAHEPLVRFWQTHKKPSLGAVVGVVVVGRFYGPVKLGAPLPEGMIPPGTVAFTPVENCGYGHLGGSDYAFGVMRYERARPAPSQRTWAGTREDKIEGDVMNLDFHWQLAVRDFQADTLDLLLADEYTLTDQGGVVRGKSRLLSDLKNTDEPMRDFIPRCERFRRVGKRGIVTGLLTNELSTEEGEAELVLGYENVYESGRGKWGWQLVSTRLSALPEAKTTAGAAAKER